MEIPVNEGTTVKELINLLLNCRMDSKVHIFLDEPSIDEQGEEVKGFIFDIDKIEYGDIYTDFVFRDWRRG